MEIVLACYSRCRTTYHAPYDAVQTDQRNRLETSSLCCCLSLHVVSCCENNPPTTDQSCSSFVLERWISKTWIQNLHHPSEHLSPPVDQS